MVSSQLGFHGIENVINCYYPNNKWSSCVYTSPSRLGTQQKMKYPFKCFFFWWISKALCPVFSSYSQFLCLPLSVQSAEGKPQTKAPISQAIRLVFCPPLILSRSSHLSFTLRLFLFAIFFNFKYISPSYLGIVPCLEQRLADVSPAMHENNS